jgi:Tat protein translocase TatB subunit
VFDFSFGEMLVIAIVGLMVLGPKELPVVIRYVRGMVRSIKQTSNAIRAQIDEVLDAEEIRTTKKLIEGKNGELYEAFSLDDFQVEKAHVIHTSIGASGEDLKQTAENVGDVDVTARPQLRS